jgi:hypothetical protein
VADFENPHQHGRLVDFAVEDVVPPGERGESTLGVGVFPVGPDALVPSSDWDTDDVWIPPRGTVN